MPRWVGESSEKPPNLRWEEGVRVGVEGSGSWQTCFVRDQMGNAAGWAGHLVPVAVTRRCRRSVGTAADRGKQTRVAAFQSRFI